MSIATSTRAASVRDVAAAAGVSVGTVSNVLNRPSTVSSGTRRRVEDAIDQLGFVRNESARQLRAGTSRTIGFVVLDSGNPFFADVARGVEGVADDSSLSVVLCNSAQHASRERLHLELLEQQRVQGILVTPVDPDAAQLKLISHRGTPLVIVDRTSSSADLCSVSVDDARGGRLAIEHLVDNGHERVALIGGPGSLGQVRDRMEGAYFAWAAAGFSPEELTVLDTHALSVQAGREAGMRIAGMRKSRRPSAVFCLNDLVALGLLQQATAMGMSVPHDLAIVGYDDIDFAAAAAVPLTSVRRPREELGRAAAELLLAEATDPTHEHRQILFEPEMIARTSTLA